MIRFDILTIFPEIIEPYTQESIIARAIEKGAIEIHIHNIRDWASDKHKTVDDRVYGGGPGMLMKIEPLYSAIKDIKEEMPEKFKKNTKVVLTSPSGTILTQNFAHSIASEEEDQAFIIICGHYEGIDYRIHKFVDMLYSVGPVILTGGELPALMFVDVITRLLPGVLGNEDSPKNETKFVLMNNTIKISGEYPQYTRPEVFEYTSKEGKKKQLKVPEVLLSGDHKKIADYNNDNIGDHEQEV
ncbi:MAG: tRNA (guanosine(37)-N1)-methyltransferase TrmD [Candidatus Dojkabacteria bacterium]|nr:MAG: tRNA (guanosine(37)-N1)-methyltransferase TrmD [Candidatus Dojkabacteria bacterium]